MTYAKRVFELLLAMALPVTALLIVDYSDFWFGKAIWSCVFVSQIPNTVAVFDRSTHHPRQ